MLELRLNEFDQKRIAALNLCRDAGLVILPAYYTASLNADQEQVIQYYIDICEASHVI